MDEQFFILVRVCLDVILGQKMRTMDHKGGKILHTAKYRSLVERCKDLRNSEVPGAGFVVNP